MATSIAIVLEDDLDGGPADQTLQFGLGRTEYEIDGRPASARERSSHILAWAKAHGIAVSARGRIPAGIAEQYDAAHG